MTESTDPRRGEVWLTSLGASRDGEPGKNRPAVVLSVDELLAGEAHELIVVVPLSSFLPRSALRPQVGSESGIDADSAAIPRALRGVSRSRLLRRLGVVEPKVLAEVEEALATVLGLDLART